MVPPFVLDSIQYRATSYEVSLCLYFFCVFVRRTPFTLWLYVVMESYLHQTGSESSAERQSKRHPLANSRSCSGHYNLHTPTMQSVCCTVHGLQSQSVTIIWHLQRAQHSDTNSINVISRTAIQSQLYNTCNVYTTVIQTALM